MPPKRQHLQIEGRELAISNVQKVYYPGSRFTKGEVIAYYDAAAEAILPHLRARPLMLKRYPEGVAGEHFYEKNAPSYTPEWVETFTTPRAEGGTIRYVLCNDRATLLWATSLGDIEKHVLLSRAPDLSRPTSLVFDLDPGEPAGLLDCARVALKLRELLASWELQSFVKVSGSKGLHMSVPLNTPITYEQTQPFAKAIAELMTQQMPKQVVADMAKRLRGGKVLIDWSQNSDFKTTVCVYAMRAKHEEPFVSAPVTWEELTRALKRGKTDSLYFTPEAAVRRIKKLGDLFASVLTLQQELPEVFTKAMAAAPPPRLTGWQRHRGRRDKSMREYAAKRDVTQTPEPAPHVATVDKAKAGGRFVIQKHAASHLHYDFRLEMQGVLRSWAVPKGPPVKVRESRLAMHVEDHPLAYADFEGTIPPGNYGAGTVMVWDFGEYEDQTGNAAAAFHAGKMHFMLRGQKLHGEWILVQDRRDDTGGRWLLIKAQEPQEPISPKLDDSSAVSGRSMSEIAEANDAQWQSNRTARDERKPRLARPAVKKMAPGFVEPMQCLAVSALPADGSWSYEIKFDGYRALAVKQGAKVVLYSRNKKSLNRRFPEIVEAVGALPGEFVIDGELVALDEHGRPSFQLLQNNQSNSQPVQLYAFDLLQRDGEDLRGLSLRARRERLQELCLGVSDPLRVSPLLQAPAGEILEAVRQLGLEGVVGKRLDSLYEAGERSGAWVKHRTNREQEFVIGGYVPGANGFDALLVGVYEGTKLIYTAKVRNGFVPRLRTELFPKLKNREIAECPFVNLPEKKGGRWGESLTAEKMKECRWVKPQLVCQVAFVEWTDAGHLRHGAFRGMRDDKRPREVVREA